jgi:hypothetical protein
MSRQSIIRILLSLLLLLSQQMAISHGMTHWAGTHGGGAAQLHQAGLHEDAGVSSAFAQDQTCERCLGFAQITGGIGSTQRCFIADNGASCATGPSPTEPGCARTHCAFQPRGPPSFE